MTATDHVLLTRFNLPSQGVESLIRAREGWLRHRIGLFERYCVPSVSTQTRRGVRWIVYLDPQSPRWLVERVRSYVDQGLLRVVFRESVSRDELRADLSETVPRRGDRLLTTNLDNDDALSSDFAERLAAVASPHPRVAVYVPTGLIKAGSGLYVRRDPRNAFCSVLESWDAPVTCWAEYHNRLPSLMPVVEVPGGAGWLQVVHGDNVSNRVRGRLASPRPYRDRFPGMVDDVPEPTRRDLATDVLVRGPARQVRDGARSAARGLAIRVLGKDGFGQAKLAVRSRMRRD